MDEELRARFSRGLRQARQKSAMSQAEVAERIGIAVEAYGRLERGAVLPRAETLVGLAYTFNVRTDDLLGVRIDNTAHGASIAHDSAVARTDPDWRRLISVLEQLSPRTLRLLANSLRALRDEPPAAAGAKAAPRR